MKILHTSDWHLGRTLYGKKRTREFEAFLDWLLATMREQEADVLIVAGDVFDTTTPGNRTQELYYRFLRRAATACRHIVVVSGNHDSPSFLDAPRELLRFLNVYVVGSTPENRVDELLELRAPDGRPELLVCAVPYLRDRDVRAFEADENPEDKERKLAEGIERHYREIAALASERRREIAREHPDLHPVPIVATGHLFAAGGRTSEGDGVRELYVGTLARVGANCFPSCIDYLALGHLHAPQKMGGSDVLRYSGAPLAMSTGESGQEKSVVLADFGASNVPKVETIAVPVFQELARVSGDLDTLTQRLNELRLSGSTAWVEVVYEGDGLVPDLRARVDAMLAGSGMELLRLRNLRALRSFESLEARETWNEIGVEDVFSRCLEARRVPETQRAELMNAYREVVASLEIPES